MNWAYIDPKLDTDIVLASPIRGLPVIYTERSSGICLDLGFDATSVEEVIQTTALEMYHLI